MLLTASFRMTFIVWLFLIFSFHHPNGTDYNGYTIEKCEKRTEIENIRCDKFWSVTKYIERTAHQNKSMKGKNKSGITSFENVVLFCCCAIRVAVLSCRCHRSCFFRFFQFFFPVHFRCFDSQNFYFVHLFSNRTNFNIFSFVFFPIEQEINKRYIICFWVRYAVAQTQTIKIRFFLSHILKGKKRKRDTRAPT